jgi:hypothetical protein
VTSEHEPGSGGTAPRAPLPQRLVVIAYALAVLSVLVPLGAIVAIVAGVMVGGRNGWRTGAGVIALAVVCAALGLALPRL